LSSIRWRWLALLVLAAGAAGHVVESRPVVRAPEAKGAFWAARGKDGSLLRVDPAIITFLGGPLSVTIGLVGVAAVIGWLIGSIVRPSLVLAVGLAIGSIALGLVGIWLFAGLEGGVLSLPDYLGQVHGPLVVIELAVAGLVAAATVR